MKTDMIRRYLDLHDELGKADAKAARTGKDVDQRYASEISSQMDVIYTNASVQRKEALRRALSAHIDARIDARKRA